MNDKSTAGSGRGGRRQSWQMAVAVLAVVAVAFGVWYAAPETRRLSGPSPTAEPSPSSPAAAVDWTRQPTADLNVTIDLDKLKRGPDPKVPWYADGVIHDGSQVTPINHGMGEWQYESVGFRAAGGAYGVSVSHPEGGGSWSALIDRQGNVLQQADIQAVSADGTLVAWLEKTDKPRSRSMVPVVRDLRTGKTIRGTKRPIASLDGFADLKVLYTTLVRGGYVEGMAIWDPATDTDEPVSPDVSNGHLLTDDVMLAILRMEGDRGWCQGLYSFKQRKPLRKPCSGGLFKAIRNSPYFTWTVRDRSVVVNARTGKGVMQLSSRNQSIAYISGEPGGALLIKLTGAVESDLGGDEGSTAIVRCSLSGECERASEVYESKPGSSKTLIELPL